MEETELPHAFHPVARYSRNKLQGKSCELQHMLDAYGEVWGAPPPAVVLGQAGSCKGQGGGCCLRVAQERRRGSPPRKPRV